MKVRSSRAFLSRPGPRQSSDRSTAGSPVVARIDAKFGVLLWRSAAPTLQLAIVPRSTPPPRPTTGFAALGVPGVLVEAFAGRRHSRALPDPDRHPARRLGWPRHPGSRPDRIRQDIGVRAPTPYPAFLIESPSPRSPSPGLGPRSDPGTGPSNPPGDRASCVGFGATGYRRIRRGTNPATDHRACVGGSRSSSPARAVSRTSSAPGRATSEGSRYA